MLPYYSFNNSYEITIHLSTMEKSLKRQIVDASAAVKKKVRAMRELEIGNKQALETVFKPITESLNLLTNTSNETTSNENGKILENSHTLNNEASSSRKYEESSDENEIDSESSFQSMGDKNEECDTSSWSLSPEALNDVPFGVRIERGKLMLGSASITIGDDFVTVAGRKYRNTPGLKQLLLKKDVDLSIVTDNDMQHYKSMLLDTNAHRRDFEPNKPIKSSKGQKYLQIIKPLFKLQSTNQIYNHPKGNGLPLTKVWRKNVDYVYWDNPNELVDRLKLLIASRDAGNTGLDNEIISIIEELRESKVIS